MSNYAAVKSLYLQRNFFAIRKGISDDFFQPLVHGEVMLMHRDLLGIGMSRINQAISSVWNDSAWNLKQRCSSFPEPFVSEVTSKATISAPA
jgi:hypothetical protein